MSKSTKTAKKVVVNILDLQSERALTAAVLDYITIKSAISGLESELDAQKSIIQEYAKVNGINGIQFEDKIVNYVPETTTHTLNKDKFKQNLLNSGVSAKIISDCEKLSIEERGRSSYLKLDKIKPKKQG